MNRFPKAHNDSSNVPRQTAASMRREELAKGGYVGEMRLHTSVMAIKGEAG